MSVDNSSVDSSAPAAALPALEADSDTFFSSGPRIPNEAGGWTLLLVPVLICLALLLFVALAPLA